MVGASRAAAVRGFLCYAHQDIRLVRRFRRLLEPRLKNARGLDISVWWDDDILVGQPWDETIRRAIADADFGLVLVSPALLSRDYIKDVELPALLRTSGTAVMPVGLQYVDSRRSDLRGLEEHQIFLLLDDRNGETKWFADLGGQNPARFCDRLAGEVVDRLLAARA
jgi:hypothetical protein